jgi:hypothetical protein
VEINICQANGKTYLEDRPGCLLVQSEGDILDLLAECGPNNTRLLMLHQDNVAPQFFDLATGLAGAVLQKLSNYFIRAVMIVDPKTIASKRFQELVYECNQGGDLHFTEDRGAGEAWLVR